MDVLTGGLAVGGRDDVEPLALQPGGHCLAAAAVVVDQQDLPLGRFRHGSFPVTTPGPATTGGRRGAPAPPAGVRPWAAGCGRWCPRPDGTRNGPGRESPRRCAGPPAAPTPGRPAWS